MLMSSFDQGAFDRERTRNSKAAVGRRARDLQVVLDKLAKVSLGKPAAEIRPRLDLALRAKGIVFSRVELDDNAQALSEGVPLGS